MKREFRLNRTILLGIAMMVIGMGLLSFTAFHIPFLHAFWPPVLILLGGFFIWRVFLLGASEIFLFMGMICVQGGILGLLNGWFSFIDLHRVWPLFLTVAGVTLIPYGFRKRRINRPVIIIPAVSFILLSLIFLPFSMGLVKMGFREFVYRWWPLLFVFLGILLLASYFGRNLKEKWENPNRPKE